MSAPLVDSHCHLDFEGLSDDLSGVLARARDAGVARIVTVGAGAGTASAERALAIAREHRAWIAATAGIHPHDARLASDEVLAEVERRLADPLVVAAGETGLDFHYDNSPREAQREAFRRQIALARKAGKPLVVHTRKAAQETLAILREERAREVGGVIHCFSEDVRFAKAALDLGFAISFSGILTFPGAASVRDAARIVPDDALLVETDAPFLAPVPHRGRRNEPAFVTETARFLAGLRGMAEDETRRLTAENAVRIFRLSPLETT